MTRDMWTLMNYAIKEFEKHIASVFVFPKEDRYVEKIQHGVVLYTKPKNELIKPFKNVHINRRLQTKGVMTHTKK